MKRFIFPIIGAALIFSLFCHAETFSVRCSSIPFANTASISAVVTTELLSDGTTEARVFMSAVLRRNGSVENVTLPDARVVGHLRTTQGLPDAQGNIPTLAAVYASAQPGEIRSIQLSVGSSPGRTADSIIQDKNGIYYKTNCHRE